jgi:hypothetical protein
MKLKIVINGTKRKVKLTQLTVIKDQYMKYPIIAQARVEYKNDAGEPDSTYIDGNDLITKFLKTFTLLDIKLLNIK